MDSEESETPRTIIRGVLAHLPVSESAERPVAATSRDRRSSAVDALRTSTSTAKKRRISMASPRTLIRGVLATQPTPENTTEEPPRKVARVTPQVRGQPTPSQAGPGQSTRATFASPSGSAPRSVRQGVRRSARISTSNTSGSGYFTRRQVGRVSSLLTPDDDTTPRTMLRNVLQVLPIESPAVHNRAEVSLLEESTPTLQEPVREEIQVQQSAQPTPDMDVSLPALRQNRGARVTRTAHITVEEFAAGVEQRLALQESQTESDLSQGETAESSGPTERRDVADQMDESVRGEGTVTPAATDSEDQAGTEEDTTEEADSALETSSQTTAQETSSQPHTGGLSSCDADDEMSSQQDRNAGNVAPDFIYTQETQQDDHATSQREADLDEFVPETQMSVRQDDNPSSQDDEVAGGYSSAVDNSLSDGEKSAADQADVILSDDDMFEDRATGVAYEVEDDRVEEEEREEVDDVSEGENDAPEDGEEGVTASGAEGNMATSPQRLPAQQQVKPVRQRRRKAPPSNNSLPRAYTKSIFTNFCKRSVSKDAMEEVEKGCEKFFQNLSKDLMMYAIHGHRQNIQVADVELLMRRQGFVTEKQSLDSLIEKYLPLEHREQLIPMATSGNKIIPNNAKGNK